MRRFVWKCNTRWLTLGLLLVLPLRLAVSAQPESTEPESTEAEIAREESIRRGQALFERQWQADDYDDPFLKDAVVTPSEDEIGDGLGPMHNAKSCVACHEQGGASGVERNVTMLTIDPRSPLLETSTQTGRARRDILEFYPGVISPSGTIALDIVLHEASTRPGYEQFRETVRSGISYPKLDEWTLPFSRSSESIAERPVLAGRFETIDYYLSQRSSPPLFGLDAIDRIDERTLKHVATKQHRISKGEISGRIGAGKFGWRAQTKTLDQFVRAACAGELGLSQPNLTQPADPADLTYRNPGFDLTEQECEDLVAFVRALPTPQPSAAIPRSARIRVGEQQFARIGCAHCHVKQLGDVENIYSDLLLHDMGETLQAPSPAPVGDEWSSAPRLFVRNVLPRRSGGFGGFSSSSYYGTPIDRFPIPFALDRPSTPQFPRGTITEDIWNPEEPEEVTWDALQREWRTPPLWGVMDSAPYLHDGRAATIEEAILMHGGEAQSAADRFRAMTPKNRERLLGFLATLVAPTADGLGQLH